MEKMTLTELSNLLGVSKSTVLRGVKKIYPDKIKHGTTTFLNKKECIKIVEIIKKQGYVKLIQNESVDKALIQNESVDKVPIPYNTQQGKSIRIQEVLEILEFKKRIQYYEELTNKLLDLLDKK